MEKLIIEITEEVSNEIKNDLGFSDPVEFVKQFFFFFINYNGLENMELAKWIISEKNKMDCGEFLSTMMRHAEKLIDKSALNG